MLAPVFLFAKGGEANYFYDANQVRYELYQTNGQKPYNWLFLPGGWKKVLTVIVAGFFTQAPPGP